jgi:hypothetical protein
VNETCFSVTSAAIPAALHAMGNEMISKILQKLFGLKPPKITDGTELEYLDGSIPALCADSKNITSTFMCYMGSHLPIEKGTKVMVYNRFRPFALFSAKTFVIKYPGGEMNVSLYETQG